MNSLRSLSRVLLVAVVAVLALTTGPLPGSASAAGSPAAGVADRGHVGAARNYYGALVISHDAYATYSYDYRTKGAAFHKALNTCHRVSNEPRTCRKVVWVRNGCAAVAAMRDAQGYVTRYAWGVSGYRYKAKRAAVRKLGGGKVLQSVCTSR